jgi:hypothetical protein
MSVNNLGGFIPPTFDPTAVPTTLDYIVVAGGGGGGGLPAGPSAGGITFGGGAGGLLQGYQYAIVQGVAYVVTIGAGGAGGNGTNGSQGVASSWNSTALGGGATISTVGGGYGATGNGGAGGNGGSGGGGAPSGSGTAGQGNAGGPSSYNVPPGAGGGAGTTGGINSTAFSNAYSACTPGANGGSGMYCFDGNIYAGGGASGMSSVPRVPPNQSLYPIPVGGLGGGGNANISGGYSTVAKIPGYPGSPNTGGGGGSSGAFWVSTNNLIQTGGAGGSGLVVIRTLATQKAAVSTTGSPTIYVEGAFRYYRFLANGSITF